MRAPNARDTALRVLVSCRTAGAWADAALRAQLRRDGLSGPEAALCSRIVYGVMQNRLLLDFYLGAYCSQKVDHLQPPLLEILRIGAYQILFLDKIPQISTLIVEYRVYNQAVEQAKDNGRAKAAGLVNAVLRQLSRNKVHLPRIPDQDALHSLSIRYSHPKWLVKRLQAILGPETEACLAADNAPAPLTIQVNPLKAAAEELTAELSRFPQLAAAIQHRPPAEALPLLRQRFPKLRPQLLPMRTAAGGGLLVSVSSDWTEIGGVCYPNLRIALTDTELGGGYTALWGGEGRRNHERMAAAAAVPSGIVPGAGAALYRRQRYTAAAAEPGAGDGAAEPIGRGGSPTGADRA